jgi:adenylate kinase
MFNVIIFGKPGSGKGTQSENLIVQYGLKHLSTGDLLRSEIAAATPLGMEAKAFIDKGQLVPDEVVIGMISTALDNNPLTTGFLFDGFPRTVAQAVALDKLVELKNTKINIVIALDVSDEELLKRLKLRGATSGRSDDTNDEVIKSRLAEYDLKTAPVLNYYIDQRKVVHINGEGSTATIFDLIKKMVDDKMENQED